MTGAGRRVLPGAPKGPPFFPQLGRVFVAGPKAPSQQLALSVLRWACDYLSPSVLMLFRVGGGSTGFCAAPFEDGNDDVADHYFSAEPSSRPEERLIAVELGGHTTRFRTDAGVFSGRQLDPGTRVLLESVPLECSGEVLDLGCGYGPIAVTLAQRSPAARVWAIDVNVRAVELARANADATGLGNVVASAPEDVPEELRFAAVYSNPPIRIGKEALHTLLLQWLGRLTPEGRAFLVVQRHLGADSLARWLQEQNFAVERLRSSRGYRVLGVCASPPVG